MALALMYESKLWREGASSVAGADEAGRGAWAGPIVAGAVCLTAALVRRCRKQPWFKQVADSKALSAATRESIFNDVEQAVPWAIGVVNNKVIDEIGIAEANRRAVRLAVTNLKERPSFALVDYVARLGNDIAGVPARVLVDGDARVFCIALASVVAKVQRDRVMRAYGERYPEYGFAGHKGYGTRTHHRAILEHGPSPIHRLSYRPLRTRLV